jgi:hypothetical protein
LIRREHGKRAGWDDDLACWESRCGRTGAALDHLAQAIEMSEEFRASRRTDSDLDTICAEPAFKQLIND